MRVNSLSSKGLSQTDHSTLWNLAFLSYVFFLILFSEFQLNLFVIVRYYMIIFRVNKIRLLVSLSSNQNFGSILEIVTNGLSPQFAVSRTSLTPGLFAL